MAEARKCVVCGASLDGRHRQTKTCTDRCRQVYSRRRKYRATRSERVMLTIAGTNVTAALNAATSAGGRVRMFCPICGTEFNIPRRRAGQRFCSYACLYKAKGTEGKTSVAVLPPHEGLPLLLQRLDRIEVGQRMAIYVPHPIDQWLQTRGRFRQGIPDAQ